MLDLATLTPALPEIILALGAMAILMFGAFTQPTDENGELAAWAAIAVMVVAGAMIVAQPQAKAVLFGTAFIQDSFARFMKLLVLSGSALALLMSFDDLRRTRLLGFELPVLMLLAAVGMMMMISAGDLIALYVGLELQSFALYIVAALRRDQVRSSEAGLKYFMLGALSSGMLLYGASLLYGFAGSTSLAAIAEAAKSVPLAENIGLIVGMVFLLVGLAFKVSAVPFHMWTPDVYEGAPTPISAFFASAVKLAAMALLVRTVISGFPGVSFQWQQIIVFISIASMLVGSFGAIGQRNFKRLMAYSSIGNVGFMLIGLAANSEPGTESVLIYLAIYLAMTLGTFACILSMRTSEGSVEDIGSLSGLAHTNLPMAASLGVLLFSLAGIPPLAGFFAKFYVFAAAIREHLYALAVIGVLCSVVSAFYYLRIVKIMFFDEAQGAFLPVERKTGIVMLAAGVFMLAYVLYPSPLLEAATEAARSLQP
jgi:NADH-quinone oxidoreductase subunit N